jgi:predicted deacylase
MAKLDVGDLSVAPGTMAKGRLGSFRLEHGAEVGIPLMVANGAREGPVLWLSAAMHGQELSGIGVIWDLFANHLDAAALRGAVIAVPMLNPFSFSGGTYFTPQDGFNLSHAFPGDPQGGLTDRLADLISQAGIRHADVVVDLHCNPETAMMFSYAFDPDVDDTGRESYRLARAFGLTTVDRPVRPLGGPMGMLDHAHHLGKPSFLVEFKPYYSIDPLARRVGLRGVQNVMKTLGLISGETVPQDEVLVLEGRLGITHATANGGGLVVPGAELGEPVRRSQVVGRVVDAYGDLVEEIISPVDGYMLAWPFLNQSVYTGDLVAMYAHPH